MPDQTAFNFMQSPAVRRNPSSRLSHRIYFALREPEELHEQIDRLAQATAKPFGLEARLTPAGRRHVSLVGTGEHQGFRRSLVDRLCSWVSTLVAPPVHVCFDRVGRFNGNAIVLYSDARLSAVQSLYRAIKDLTRHEPLVGLHGKREISPHMTLFYAEAPFAGIVIEPICWLATEFVLVHSHDRHHEILGCWRLVGEPYRPTGQTRPGDLFG